MVRGLIFLISLSLLLLSCSSDPTGSTVAGHTNTLTVTVKDTTGTLLDGAEVWVNGIAKGETSKYGLNKGTRMVLLKGEDTSITVQKVGYASFTTLITSSQEPQFITAVLEKKKTTFKISVESQMGDRAENAKVMLFEHNKSKASLLTDRQGRALFENLDDGNYSIKVVQEGYLKEVEDVVVKYADDGDVKSLRVILAKIPQLQLAITDAQGGELANAEVSVYTKKEYNSPNSWPMSIHYTDADGLAKFSELEPNEYVFVLKKEGYTAKVEEITFDAEHQQFTFSLEKYSS